MASLNTSQNGPSITKSYQTIINSSAPAGAAASSPTYGQWAVFAVQAPLVSAFQGGASKESVLKVQSTGEGELVDLIDEFSDGRIQFAFLKVKDTNSGLPKNVLIAWCGEGVPERTKGYFGSHLEAVSKLLHGYHVQVTARSDRDLTPESIIQKVADASGSNYAGGPAMKSAGGGAPAPIASKPVFQPTKVGGSGTAFNPLGARSRAPAPSVPTDNDGWGEDAPELTRTQLEKVAPAYKPTRVNIAELQQQHRPSGYVAPAKADTAPSDVVRGGYQPIGKVDINEIRRQAKNSGSVLEDERPTIVKGAYEPVGKVDIAAIRARAQAPGGAAPSAPSISPAATGGGQDEAPKSLSQRSSAFQQSERMTSLPKPKVANKFGGASNFTGTRAPAPGGFTASTPSSAAPVGVASRTFADEGGKTPAQIWAEKKARERGSSITSGAGNSSAPIATQPSGEGGWTSGYSGKKWGAVNTTHTGRSGISSQHTGNEDEEQEAEPPSGGVSSVRDRFAGGNAPPPMDLSSKPNAGGVPMPGLPSRPSAARIPSEEHVNVPPPPAVPRSPTPEPEEEEEPIRSGSPIRVAMPVRRKEEPEMEAAEELHPSQPVPAASLAAAARAVPTPREEEPEEVSGRHAAQVAAASTFGNAAVASSAPQAASGGLRALVQYDYEKAEDNELELMEGSYVTNIDKVDEDWWHGTNEKGESGLFPSNYVEIIEGGDDAPGAGAPSAPAMEAAPPAGPAGGAGGAPTATALYDYEAAEDNELSFPDGATITNVEFPDDDWWSGEYGGKAGLFPANYVQLDE